MDDGKEPEGICLDAMTLHTMCISGTNLEGKMQGALQQCFMNPGAAAQSRGRRPGSGKGGCPSFASLKAMMSEKMTESDCLYQSIGWLDENGNDVNATISADIASLDPALGSQLSPEIVGECVMNELTTMAQDPKYVKCAEKYNEEQTQILGDIASKMATFECFSKTFDKACKSFIQTAYIEPLLSTFSSPQMLG